MSSELLSVGQKFNQFTVVKRVGNNWNVFLIRDEVTKREMIIKALLIGADVSQQKAMDADVKVGMRVSKGCIFLVRYEQVLMKGDICYLLMEYCSMGDLSKIIANRVKDQKPFSEEEILRFLFQVGKAVEALHKADVVHRDLKPENIYLTSSGIFKVGDFGISRSIDPSQKKTTVVVATIGYASPEILDGDNNISKAIDIYSLGCILLELLDLRHPFANDGGVIQQRRVFSGKINESTRSLSSTTQTIRDLAVQMISQDPTRRPSIETVLALPIVLVFASTQYIEGLSALEKAQKEIQALTETNHRLEQERMASVVGPALLAPASASAPAPSPASDLASTLYSPPSGSDIASLCVSASASPSPSASVSASFSASPSAPAPTYIPSSVSLTSHTSLSRLAHAPASPSASTITSRTPSAVSSSVSASASSSSSVSPPPTPSSSAFYMPSSALSSPSPSPSPSSVSAVSRVAVSSQPVSAASSRNVKKTNSGVRGDIVMVISCSLRPNSQGDCTITTTTHNNNTASEGGNGNRCVFGKSNTTRTVFVDKCITEGIYRWTVKVDFSQGCNFFIGCAMCSGSSLSVWDDNWLGDSGSTCSVEVYASGAKTALHGVNNDSRSERKVSITCSSLLSLEIDSTAGTLSFFIDEKKEPFVISKIRVPLYFGLSKSFNTAAFTSLSLRRLAAATASPVVCTYFECNDA